MRAAVVAALGGTEGLELRELPDPEPGPGQVLIRVRFAGLNFADVNARRGRYPHRLPPLPFVPGLEVAGTVAALGEGVTGLEVGQRVVAFTVGGSYADYALASAGLTIPIPERLGWEQAGAFPIVTLTAYHLLTTAGRLAPGESVLVQAAAGGVGTVAVQLARLLGAGLVLGTAGSDEKARYATEFGADEVINYRTGDFGARALERTGWRGVDLVLDAVGGAARERSLEVLAPLGRLVMFGNASAEPELQISTTELRERAISAVGFNLSMMRLRQPDTVRQSAQQLINWLAEGRFRINVTRVFPLSEVAAAHRHLETRESRGKLLLRVAED